MSQCKEWRSNDPLQHLIMGCGGQGRSMKLKRWESRAAGERFGWGEKKKKLCVLPCATKLQTEPVQWTAREEKERISTTNGKNWVKELTPRSSGFLYWRRVDNVGERVYFLRRTCSDCQRIGHLLGKMVRYMDIRERGRGRERREHCPCLNLEMLFTKFCISFHFIFFF